MNAAEMRRAARFTPGETALLHNDNGGRLFIVHECTADGAIERHPTPGQQKYVQRTPHDRLLKLESLERAHMLMGALMMVTRSHERRMAESKRIAQTKYRRLWDEFDVEAMQETDLENDD